MKRLAKRDVCFAINTTKINPDDIRRTHVDQIISNFLSECLDKISIINSYNEMTGKKHSYYNLKLELREGDVTK